jgi:photosystem II stability/assembly factor-like uncharacterized protein
MTATLTLTPIPVTPTLTETPVPLTTLSDLAFIDPTHGWALGAACDSQGNCPLALRKSVDGGRTWSVLLAPHGALEAAEPGAPAARRLTFASLRDGWAYSPSLFSTHDGGSSWSLDPVSAEILAVESGGDNVWAVARSCTSAGACALQLLSSPLGGGPWTPLPTQPPFAGDQAVLQRYGATDGWLLSWSGMAPTSGQLAVTHDNGSTWHLLPDPTTARMCTAKLLAVADASRLWLLCGGEGATIMMDKALFGSSDGGASWSMLADATPPGNPGKNNLSLTGHVADLAAPDPQHVFIGLGRSTLIASIDGGHTWKPSIPLDPQLAGDVGVERVVFIDREHGWALSGPDTLYRTEDAGVHWEVVPVE